METRAPYVLVGAFVLLAGAGLIGFILWVALPGDRAEDATYAIYFDDTVSGLDPGSAVSYRGVPVGRVTDIRIDPDDFTRIRVLIAVRRDTPIKAGASATLRLTGVTGQRTIEIEGGGAQAPDLVALEGQDYPVIPSRLSSIESLLGGTTQVLDVLTQAAQNITSLLDEPNRTAIGQSLANVAALTGSFAERKDEIEANLDALAGLIGDLREGAQELSATLAVARMTFATADAEAAAAGKELRALGTAARASADSLTRTGEELSALIAENRGSIRDFTGEGLPQLSLLLQELRELTENLSRIAREFESNPRGYLFGTPAHERTTP